MITKQMFFLNGTPSIAGAKVFFLHFVQHFDKIAKKKIRVKRALGLSNTRSTWSSVQKRSLHETSRIDSNAMLLISCEIN